MNELILELAKKAGARADFGITGVEDENFLVADIYDLEMFFQLIVEECARICDVVRESNGGDKQFGARLCADEIRWMNRRS